MNLHWYRHPQQAIQLPLQGSCALRVFMTFALAYIISYAFRSINAVISPELIRDLHLSHTELGFLSSAYFIGFGMTQIPVGLALDRFGPRATEMVLMSFAIIGALIFAVADQFLTLVIGRVCIGIGVSACLMSAFSAFRTWFPAEQQPQLVSAMLVFGTFGALMTSWPVHEVLPFIGWRGVFVAMAVLSALAIFVLYIGLPVKARTQPDSLGDEIDSDEKASLSWKSYRPIMTNAFFWRILPLGIFCYGGFIAIQTLWFGPWLIQVMDYSATTTAQILFGFNAVLLCAYLTNAWILPKLANIGIDTMRYMTWMVGTSIVLQACAFYWRGPWGWAWWYLVAVACASYVLAQSLIVTYFPKAYSGRVSTTYNLSLFIGAFIVQWGIGYLVDLGIAAGWSHAGAFDVALGVFLIAQAIAFTWFLLSPKYFPATIVADEL
ncbi:MFS transporter [Polynucleobacter sp.]|uniref:MFS transporter n=1 Tax=Polynucleobacter sp. TaxID=2029855 RepID=UPI002733C8FC|nr:MFS transporter [Polynucleobacter sp.]MDP3121673.1 MFS transporter [Polynucleobacter sp.]